MAQSFLERLGKQSVHVPDVLACLANLSNDEVFTPPDVVNTMLDMLPQELFQSTETTFLDPACKTGVFLREIAKRLLNYQLPYYNDRVALINEKQSLNIPLSIDDEAFLSELQRCIDHIFQKQLFGISITELTSLLSRRSLYCSKYPNGQYSISHFNNAEGNIRYRRTNHTWKDGSCIFCGANQSQYDRASIKETHAYEFIHTMNPERLLNLKIDLIISNPPFQLNDGGSGTGISAKPIYQHFIDAARKLNPRFIAMICPSRWFAGGKGLDEFRVSMLKDKRIKEIYDFMSSKDCFPGVNIAGGVNYFLWERDYSGDCKITNCSASSEPITATRALDEFPVFIRDNRAISIIHKFLKSDDPSLANNTFTRNPFGFVSKDRGSNTPSSDNDVRLISSAGVGFVPRENVLKNKDQIDKFKVTIGKIVPANGEVDTDPNDGYKVTTTSRILNPGEIHTESYLLLHGFDKYEEAHNFATYMALKFPRFMMKHTLSSMNISTQNFMFVPFLDYSKTWTDEELYKRYGLTDTEIDYVEKIIRPLPNSPSNDATADNE